MGKIPPWAKPNAEECRKKAAEEAGLRDGLIREANISEFPRYLFLPEGDWCVDVE
jgi:hypothetical protein